MYKDQGRSRDALGRRPLPLLLPTTIPRVQWSSSRRTTGSEAPGTQWDNRHEASEREGRVTRLMGHEGTGGLGSSGEIWEDLTKREAFV